MIGRSPFRGARRKNQFCPFSPSHWCKSSICKVILTPRTFPRRSNIYETHMLTLHIRLLMQGTVFKYAFMLQEFPANNSFIITVNMTLPLQCLLCSLGKGCLSVTSFIRRGSEKRNAECNLTLFSAREKTNSLLS